MDEWDMRPIIHHPKVRTYTICVESIQYIGLEVVTLDGQKKRFNSVYLQNAINHALEWLTNVRVDCEN